MKWANLVLALLALADYSIAETLNDPTRPATMAVATDTAVAADSALVLQSILVSPGRRMAIINGQAVKQGDKLGEMRVTGIRESEVVLRSDHEVKVLKLFPAVEKESMASRAANKNDRRPQ